jgi:hypothetical protein
MKLPVKPRSFSEAGWLSAAFSFSFSSIAWIVQSTKKKNDDDDDDDDDADDDDDDDDDEDDDDPRYPI